MFSLLWPVSTELFFFLFLFSVLAFFSVLADEYGTLFLFLYGTYFLFWRVC